MDSYWVHGDLSKLSFENNIGKYNIALFCDDITCGWDNGEAVYCNIAVDGKIKEKVKVTMHGLVEGNYTSCMFDILLNLAV